MIARNSIEVIPSQREPLRQQAIERLQNRYHQLRIGMAATSLVRSNVHNRSTPARQREIWQAANPNNQSLEVIQCADGVIYRLKRLTPNGDHEKLEISCWGSSNVHYGSEVISADYTQVTSSGYITNVPSRDCTAELSDVSREMNSLVGIARSAERSTPPLLQSIHDRLGIKPDRL